MFGQPAGIGISRLPVGIIRDERSKIQKQPEERSRRLQEQNSPYKIRRMRKQIKITMEFLLTRKTPAVPERKPGKLPVMKRRPEKMIREQVIPGMRQSPEKMIRRP